MSAFSEATRMQFVAPAAWLCADFLGLCTCRSVFPGSIAGLVHTLVSALLVLFVLWDGVSSVGDSCLCNEGSHGPSYVEQVQATLPCSLSCNYHTFYRKG